MTSREWKAVTHQNESATTQLESELATTLSIKIVCGNVVYLAFTTLTACVSPKQQEATTQLESESENLICDSNGGREILG